MIKSMLAIVWLMKMDLGHMIRLIRVNLEVIAVFNLLDIVVVSLVVSVEVSVEVNNYSCISFIIVLNGYGVMYRYLVLNIKYCLYVINKVLLHRYLYKIIN